MKGIMKGIGIGMAVGGATAFLKGVAAGNGMKRMARKKAKIIMKTIDGIAGDMKYMFK